MGKAKAGKQRRVNEANRKALKKVKWCDAPSIKQHVKKHACDETISRSRQENDDEGQDSDYYGDDEDEGANSDCDFDDDFRDFDDDTDPFDDGEDGDEAATPSSAASDSSHEEVDWAKGFPQVWI